MGQWILEDDQEYLGLYLNDKCARAVEVDPHKRKSHPSCGSPATRGGGEGGGGGGGGKDAHAATKDKFEEPEPEPEASVPVRPGAEHARGVLVQEDHDLGRASLGAESRRVSSSEPQPGADVPFENDSKMPTDIKDRRAHRRCGYASSAVSDVSERLAAVQTGPSGHGDANAAYAASGTAPVAALTDDFQAAAAPALALLGLVWDGEGLRAVGGQAVEHTAGEHTHRDGQDESPSERHRTGVQPVLVRREDSVLSASTLTDSSSFELMV